MPRSHDADDGIPPLPDDLLEDPTQADWSGEAPPVPERIAVSGDRLVLPWRTRVTLLDRGITLPAVLDPARADSAWIVTEARLDGRTTARLRLGDLDVDAELTVSQGDDPGLVLGRDVLSDRVLVASVPHPDPESP